MYNVVIVDDELLPAKLLEKYIEAYAEGYRVVGIFKDGTDAIKYINNNGEVNVVMTDIRMEKMSGIQLAKYIHTMNPDIEVIFVSAYADFEYAKNAIENNVFGYLLKAVDVNELTGLMRQLKKKLDSNLITDPESIQVQRDYFTECLILKKFKERNEMYREQKKCMFKSNDNTLICTLLKIEFGSFKKLSNLVAKMSVEKFISTLIGIIKCASNKENVCNVYYKENIFYVACIGDESLDAKNIEDIINEIVGIESNIEKIKQGTFENYFEMEKPLIEMDFCDDSDDVKYKEIIRSAIEYISVNLNQNISRNSVAEVIHLAPAYFGRLFKKEIGVSFSDYIYSERMKCAVILLREGMSTSEVCKAIGYVDERSFRRQFKIYSGKTPAEFRKMRGNTSV